MWRPVTHALLICSCSLGLFTSAGCSLFRADIAESFVATPPQHLPAIQESTAPRIAPSAPVAAAAPQTSLTATTAPSEPRPEAKLASQPVPLAATTTADEDSSPKAPQDETCYIEIRAKGKEPKRIRMSLADAPHIQKVLEQTKLVKKFRNMEIELSRKLPGDGPRHKLEIRYDSKRKHVVSAFDYALHADDLLVIREDSTTALDTMLKKLAGPLAR